MLIFRPGGQNVQAARGARVAQPQGAAGNGLLNALIAYWPGNEVNGNALDLHTNALHLTDVNTVTSNPGQVYALARQYTAVNMECHTRPGDDALLSVADLDFTLAAWVRLDTIVADRSIASKFNNAAGANEYILRYYQTVGRFRWNAWDGTNVIGAVNSTSAGAVFAATWYLVVAWHDSVANTVSIQVNGGVVDSAATTGAPGNGTAPFVVGFYTAGLYMDGRIGPTMFWKSAAGGGGVLTAAQRTALYNAGAGLAYSAFTT